MDPSIQLASPARKPKINPAHQSPQPNRGQPVDAPQLVPLIIIGDNCGTSIRMIETTYAKLLVGGKRREFIERGPWTVEQVRDGVREVPLGRCCGRVGPRIAPEHLS